MKTLITYYSFSGNTEKVVKIFADVIKQKSEVDVQRLKPENEIKDFAGQCRAAFTRKRTELKDGIKYDASPYDVVLIGSPVWAFAPTPAINTYLDKISGLNGKKAILLLTSGSGLGVKKCFKNMETVLQNKGVTEISEINIPDRKQGDEAFIVSAIKKVMG